MIHSSGSNTYEDARAYQAEVLLTTPPIQLPAAKPRHRACATSMQCRESKMASRWPQDGPKMAPTAQTWPNMAPKWPKMAPRWPKMATRWPGRPQEGPRWPQGGPKVAPRRANEGPRWPQDGPDGPRKAQDGPKVASDGPKVTPRWPHLPRLQFFVARRAWTSWQEITGNTPG